MQTIKLLMPMNDTIVLIFNNNSSCQFKFDLAWIMWETINHPMIMFPIALPFFTPCRVTSNPYTFPGWQKKAQNKEWQNFLLFQELRQYYHSYNIIKRLSMNQMTSFALIVFAIFINQCNLNHGAHSLTSQSKLQTLLGHPLSKESSQVGLVCILFTHEHSHAVNH